jgi:thioredoxin reductase (NADPH)
LKKQITILILLENFIKVDKDYKGQVTTLQGNVEFYDGTKETTLDYFNNLLDSEEIDARFNTEVKKIVRNEETNLLEIHTSIGLIETKNAVVSIGKMVKPNKPDYKIPPSIKTKVNFNLDKCSSNEKILVVGGGNSAAEYAYDLADQNNNVTLVYRKAEFSRLNKTNENLLKKYSGEEKLRFRMNTDILSLENEEGKIKVEFNDRYSVLFDRIIYAIGGTTPVDFLKSCGSIAIALNHGYHIVNNILRKRGKIFSHTEKFSKPE